MLTFNNEYIKYISPTLTREYESNYLRCDEWATGVYCRCDEVDELALVLTVDLAVELCKPMRVGLQSSKGLCMSVTNKTTHTVKTVKRIKHTSSLYSLAQLVPICI